MNDVQPDPETSREMQAEQVRHLMALLAPGTPIREGLDRIVNGRTGGLIVLGDGPEINGVCSGGFPLDVRLTPQALATLASYRGRLVDEAENLTTLEIRDQVQVRDVAAVAQRVEMWRRIDVEVRGYVSALGVEGRLVQLQRNELSLGVEDLGRLLTDDYRPNSVAPGGFSLSGLQKLSWEDLLNVTKVAETINLGPAEHPLDSPIRARGHRQLTLMTDLSSRTIQRIIDHFNDLQSLVSASTSELSDIKGVGLRRAREIRQGLESIFEGDQRTHHLH